MCLHVPGQLRHEQLVLSLGCRWRSLASSSFRDDGSKELAEHCLSLLPTAGHLRSCNLIPTLLHGRRSRRNATVRVYFVVALVINTAWFFHQAASADLLPCAIRGGQKWTSSSAPCVALWIRPVHCFVAHQTTLELGKPRPSPGGFLGRREWSPSEAERIPGACLGWLASVENASGVVGCWWFAMMVGSQDMRFGLQCWLFRRPCAPIGCPPSHTHHGDLHASSASCSLYGGAFILFLLRLPTPARIVLGGFD